MVEVYDPATKKKAYVGTYMTEGEALAVEAAVRAGRPIPRRDPLADYVIDAEPVVYFIAAPELGMVKIGYSEYLAGRLRDLTMACPVELRVMHIERGGTPERERALHREFRVFRVRGEWFRIAGALAEFLDRTFDDPRLSLVEAEGAAELSAGAAA